MIRGRSVPKWVPWTAFFVFLPILWPVYILGALGYLLGSIIEGEWL